MFYSPVNFSSQALPITLTGSAADPAGTVRYIGSGSDAENLVFNVPAGGTLGFSIAGASFLSIAAAQSSLFTGATTGNKLGGYFYDASGTPGYRTAWEVAAIASGFGTLTLMQGAVTISYTTGTGIVSQVPFILQSGFPSPAGTARYLAGGGTAEHWYLNCPSGGAFHFLFAGSERVKFNGSTAIATDVGGVIFGTSVSLTPARRLELLDTSAAQFRLTYTQGSVFKDFTVDANGCVTIEATGGTGTGILKIGTVAGGTYPLQVHSGTGNVSAYFVGSVRFMATSGGYYDISSAAASGEFLAGGLATSGTNLAIKPGNSVGDTFQIIYYNGSAYASALEIASAAAAGTLYLMKSGGLVSIGSPIALTGTVADPAGTVRYIGTGGNANRFIYNVPSTGYHEFWVAGSANLKVASTVITLLANGGSVVLGGAAGLTFTNATKLTPSGTLPILYGDTEAHLWIPSGSNFYIRTATSGGAIAYFSDTNSAISLGISTGRFALYGATPVVQSTGWSITNPTSRKTIDVAAATLGELRELVGTLLQRMLDLGAVAA